MWGVLPPEGEKKTKQKINEFSLTIRIYFCNLALRDDF